ncbi:MAG: hypothetical protein LUD27_08920 [Clostridia bacterium]|nr:hypothetical protein [Clostridia bacterium]
MDYKDMENWEKEAEEHYGMINKLIHALIGKGWSAEEILNLITVLTEPDSETKEATEEAGVSQGEMVLRLLKGLTEKGWSVDEIIDLFKKFTAGDKPGKND